MGPENGQTCVSHNKTTTDFLLCKDLFIPECYDMTVYCTDVPKVIDGGSISVIIEPTGKYRNDGDGKTKDTINYQKLLLIVTVFFSTDYCDETSWFNTNTMTFGEGDTEFIDDIVRKYPHKVILMDM